MAVVLRPPLITKFELPARSVSLYTFTYLSLALTVAPFTQADWPNPRGPQRSVDLLTWSQSPAQPVLPPFSQTDWPNPRGPSRLPEYTIAGSLNLSIQPTYLPFGAVSEQRYSRSLVFRSVYGSPIEILLQTQTPPPTNYDWPIPKGKPPLNVGFSDSFKLPLTTVAPPFTQYDWRVPTSQHLSRLRRTWIHRGNAPLTIVFGVPAPTNYDWPVPKGRPPLNVGFSDSFKLPLTTVRPPNLQRDWPNPRGYVPGITLLTWTDSFKLPLQTIRPLNQSSWPVPKGKQRLTKKPFLGVSANILLMQTPDSTGLLPKSKDWPNPLPPRPIRIDFFDRNSLLLTSIAPLQPVSGLKFLYRHVAMGTTGPNIVLALTPPPLPPTPPASILPPKTHRAFVRSGLGIARTTSGSGHTEVSSGKSKSDAQDP